MRAAASLLLRRVHFSCGKDWHPVGSHKPDSRGSIPRPANPFTTRRVPACTAGSPKPSPPGAAPGLRATFNGDRGVSVSIAGCEPAGTGANPVGLPTPYRAARLVRKSAGLHPAVHGAKPWRSTISQIPERTGVPTCLIRMFSWFDSTLRNHSLCSPIRRGTTSRTWTVRVQILPQGPVFPQRTRSHRRPASDF